MIKSTVIHHSADYDGLFCREIARKFLPPETQFIGWDYGNPRICLDGVEGPVYILDLSPDCLHQHPDTPNGQVPPNVIWIDHHKSAIEEWPHTIPGYRIDGVAACRLVWQWFTQRSPDGMGGWELPAKQAFIDRVVEEPLSVQLAGEYDILDKRSSEPEIFQFGLDAVGAINWEMLLHVDSEVASDVVGDMLNKGVSAMRVIRKRDADVMQTRSYRAEFQDLTFLCLNTARCNSNTFAALDLPNAGHDALMGFYWNGNDWSVSLYHSQHKTELDLSLIAKRFGGGGHRGACGFRTGMLPGMSKLPFIS